MFVLPTLAELNLVAVLPATIVAVGMCLLLLLDLWVPAERKVVTAWYAIGILVLAFIANLLVYNRPGEAMFGMFVADTTTAFLNIVVLLTAFIAVLLSVDYLKRAKMEKGEFYSLVLFSASGAMFMVSANDLVLIFIALELLSIPLYVMAAFRYPTRDVQPDSPMYKVGVKSEESGMKYFILGAFASAFLVYGSALIYGGSGSTNLNRIFEVVSILLQGENSQAVSPLLLLMGASLLLVGLGFKVAVFPFHMWTPDVYEGAPTNVTAYMSVVAKVGGFAALARVMASALPVLVIGGAETAAWQLGVSLIAGLTMVLGNFVALSQTNIKRMLAYSSIAHAGYIMMAIAAAGSSLNAESTLNAVSVYLMSYMFTNLGAFAVAMALEKADGSGTNIEDFVGLYHTQPQLALLMALFMLSLTGIPLTGGFIGKYFVFGAAVEAQLYPLAIVGVLTSVASAFYYMRVVINMFLRDDQPGDPAEGATPYLMSAVYISAVGVLVMGIFPTLATNLFPIIPALIPFFGF